MNQLPFKAYDVFAYLASGSVVAAGADYIYGSQWLLQEKHSAVFSLVLIFGIYLTGHIVATCSAAVFESIVVGRLLGRPSTILMRGEKSKASWLFPLYYRPLPVETRERIAQRLERKDFVGEGEALFLHIFSTVKHGDATKLRLEEFRNMYGFARNVSFSFLMLSVMIAVVSCGEGGSVSLGWALVALFAAVAMFYRYLKFLRQFSYEAFVTYSELPVGKNED